MSSIIPLPQFPNVPPYPGVPQLVRPPGVSASAPSVQQALAAAVANARIAQRPWGIQDASGNLVVQPDSIIDTDYEKSFDVITAPLEDGSFTSFNKIENPYQKSVVLVKGGTKAERRALLQACDALVASLSLYTIITPEKRYTNANCTHYSLPRHSAQGANFLAVRLYFTQIRQLPPVTVAGVPFNATIPDAMPVTNIGAISPQPLSNAALSGTLDALQSANTGGGTVRSAIQSAIQAGQSAANGVAAISNQIMGVAQSIASDLINGQQALANIAGTVLNSVISLSTIVPLISTASQTLSVQLGGQLAQLAVYQKGSGLFMDLLQDGSPMKVGMPCLDRNMMLSTSAYQGFKGNFTFVDTQGKTDPSYATLGTRHQLVYTGAPS